MHRLLNACVAIMCVVKEVTVASKRALASHTPAFPPISPPFFPVFPRFPPFSPIFPHFPPFFPFFPFFRGPKKTWRLRGGRLPRPACAPSRVYNGVRTPPADMVDAEELCSEWTEHPDNGGAFEIGFVHSGLPKDELDARMHRLRSGQMDVVVQVQQLGEGFDLPRLSVAAFFHAPASMAPFAQFVGRVVRWLTPSNELECRPRGLRARHLRPGDNRCYLVAHPLLQLRPLWLEYVANETPPNMTPNAKLRGSLHEVEVVSQTLAAKGLVPGIAATVDFETQATTGGGPDRGDGGARPRQSARERGGRKGKEGAEAATEGGGGGARERGARKGRGGAGDKAEAKERPKGKERARQEPRVAGDGGPVRRREESGGQEVTREPQRRQHRSGGVGQKPRDNTAQKSRQTDARPPSTEGRPKEDGTGSQQGTERGGGKEGLKGVTGVNGGKVMSCTGHEAVSDGPARAPANSDDDDSSSVSSLTSNSDSSSSSRSSRSDSSGSSSSGSSSSGSSSSGSKRSDQAVA